MIADKANYGNAIASPEGTLIYCNNEFARMHGWTIGDIVGKNLSMLHTESQLIRVKESIMKLHKEGEFSTMEIWRLRKDGTMFPSLMNAMLVDINSRPGYMWATAIDITDMKAAEDALRASEQRLNYAQELAKMGSWEHDFKSNILTGSKNYLRLLGLNPGEEIKDLFQHFISHVHPDDISEIRHLQTHQYTNDQTVSVNIRINLPDGNIRWLQNNIVPVFDNGILVGLRGVNIDITEKKAYEDQLKKWNLAIEQSPVSIMITDLVANIQYVNPSFEQTTGYSSDEIIGKNASILKSGKTSKITYKALWKTIKAGRNWQSELRNRRKNGEIYWESISINPITDENGKISNYLAIKQDISARKRAEQEILDLNSNLEEKIKARTKELENFFSVSLDLLCIADMSGKFIKVNKSWETLLGIPISELQTRKVFDFIHPDDLEITREMMKLLKGQVPIITFINRYRSYDSQYRFLEWRSVPVGKLIYAAARDVTERIRNEEDLRKARLEAEKANNAKSEFLSRMSHELRTPMNSILGFAQLLEMGELSPAHRKGVNHIIKSGKHLLELINEVLDISRIEAGRMNLIPEPIELKSILHEIIDSLQAQANEHSIHLEIINSPSVTLSVISDRQRLRQVILNLVTNAIKYNHPGGSVWIRTVPAETRPEHIPGIRIEVSDNGPGIPAESLSKLFTPFERIGADKTTIVGTGLGLSVVKTLTEAMGGYLGVESIPNVKTTFWIELPRAEIEPIAANEQNHSPREDDTAHDLKGTTSRVNAHHKN
jgi:PAS domain S-box-containing protein